MVEKCKTRSPVIFIMSSIYSRNKKILKNWEEECNNNNEEDFVKDGILNKGELCNSKKGLKCKRQHSKYFKKERELWEKAPMRFLFITKELNPQKGDPWDVREEAGGRIDKDKDVIPEKDHFNKNVVFQLYGLGNTKPKMKKYIKWGEIDDKKALNFYDTCAFARINVKKQSGRDKTDDRKLSEYVKKYQCYLCVQIRNLDADIIVCGGSKEVILNFLKEKCYEDLKKVDPKDGWIYYSKKYNKIAIDSWHPSYTMYQKVTQEEFYDGMICSYFKFLNKHKKFAKPHR